MAMTSRAMISSVTSIVPSSAVNAALTRPARTIAVKSGAISRVSATAGQARRIIDRPEFFQLICGLEHQDNPDYKRNQGHYRDRFNADLIHLGDGGPESKGLSLKGLYQRPFHRFIEKTGNAGNVSQEKELSCCPNVRPLSSPALFSLDQLVCVRRHFKNILEVSQIENGFDPSACAGQGKPDLALAGKLERFHESGYSRAVYVGTPPQGPLSCGTLFSGKWATECS